MGRGCLSLLLLLGLKLLLRSLVVSKILILLRTTVAAVLRKAAGGLWGVAIVVARGCRPATVLVEAVLWVWLKLLLWLEGGSSGMERWSGSRGLKGGRLSAKVQVALGFLREMAVILGIFVVCGEGKP